jgi:hypothetical protein
MVTANSGCVIMNVKGNNVIYYEKCNHCQASEYDNKPYKEAPVMDEGISELGEYTCKKCGKESPIALRFHK